MNRLILLVGGFLLLLLLTLWAIWPQHQAQPGSAQLPRVLPEPRDLVLYFADPAGLFLISEERRVAGCNEERQCIAQTLEALIDGSERLQPLLPVRTRVLGVEVEGDLARVSFSRELVDQHPGGSLSELLTVYGLTNTLMVNFPALEHLQILIEGKVEPTLKGHVDISRPLTAEFGYSQAPAGIAPATGSGYEPPAQ